MSEKQLPNAVQRLMNEQPQLWSAYCGLGKAAAESGPLSSESKRLVKLALAIGGDSEGAVHSHTRQALAEGHTPEALRQVALLSVTTLGFPKMVKALSWIDDVIEGRG